MKKKFFRLFISMFLFIVLPVFYSRCAPGSSKNSEPLSLRQAIDKIVTQRLHVGTIIGIITRNQRQVFSYGVKTLDGNEKPDENTVFEIGSITKTFTTIILADMHLKGEVNLEKSIILPIK